LHRDATWATIRGQVFFLGEGAVEARRGTTASAIERTGADGTHVWPAVAALLLSWGAGAWLVGGALREAGAAGLIWLFHAVAAVAAGALALAVVRDARRSGAAAAAARRDALGAAFHELGAGNLVGASGRARALPGELGPPFEHALAGIGGRVERLQTHSLEVAGAAEGVERGAGALAAGATQQAAAAGEVTAAMEELARTAAEISEHAERQSLLVARAEAEGAAGAGAVAEAVAGIAAVESRIGEVTSRADTLGSRSREIFRVLELISEIAQETHLLSLNAALEAAAAGDRGRRFAVVAGEVRVLAERVRDSVASVRSQVEEFASAIRATVVATEEGSKEVARVQEEARAATTAIEQLRTALAESSEAARQISSVTRQQTAASEEVVATLRELHQVVERMSRDLRALSETATRLRSVGLDLQLLAQTFRLDSPRSLKRLVDRWNDRVAAGDPGEQLAALVGESRFVEAGYLVDTGGRLVAMKVGEAFAAAQAATAEDLRRIDMRERPWYRAAVDAGGAVVMPPQQSLLSGEQVLTVAVPRRGDDGELRGVVGFDVNVRNWTEISG
jgi:methyl-accepting chemotaxis protein